MLRLFNVMIMAGVGAALMAPLLYALATLRGMRHKRVYPILRLRQQDGHWSFVVREFEVKQEEPHRAIYGMSHRGADLA
ncbi:MAG TPA: hypothetical protein VJM82_00180 [Nitrospiraceae bacterium]|nr:hypothetical protein [Nitrospiraceae bacterium]